MDEKKKERDLSVVVGDTEKREVDGLKGEAMEEITRDRKISLLKKAGYSVEEIRELEKDGYDFDEAVCFITSGHTKKEIENGGGFDLLKISMKEAGYTNAEIARFEEDGFI